MGLFNFLKKHGFSKDFRISEPIDNVDYQRKRQAEIDRLEKKYDLSTVEGINAIPVPTRKSTYNGMSVTGKIEYYLIMKAGGYEQAGKVELALACYRKANELMPMSSTSYPYETYMRLPRYLRKLRRFDEARKEETKIKLMFPDGGVFSLSKAEFIKDMKMIGHSQTKAEALYTDYKAERDEARKKENDRADYDWIWEFMPELCPKSFSGYRRMKKAQTENFKKIVVEAKKNGRNIE